MEFSYAVAVMDKFGGWEKKKEDENQIGARCEACMSICPGVHEEFRVQVAFDYRGYQLVLGLSL